MKHIHFESITSTHSYLSEHYHSLSHLTLVSADHQTQGIGRLDRFWHGDEKSIMCSFLLKEQLDDMNISLIPLCAAVSVHKVLSSYCNEILIKWPNDLWIHGMKLSGILVKSIIESNHVLAVIISFGININQTQFHDDIKTIATSLKIETNETYDKDNIMHDIISQFLKDLNLLKKDSSVIIDYCNQYAALTHQNVKFIRQGKSYHGMVKHINDDGHLVVICQDETMILNSGEVVLYQNK
jgi:BirA family biotin operon repressor/biotin-[acetyl-CoA-carboxylase] ligase